MKKTLFKDVSGNFHSLQGIGTGRLNCAGNPHSQPLMKASAGAMLS